MSSPIFPNARAMSFLVLLAACNGIENEPKPVDDTGGGAEECERPVANAGADQAVTLGDAATLDGSASTVCLTDDRTWSWSFEAVPTDSAIDDSAFSDNKTMTASAVAFTPDVPGDYVISLVVSDGEKTSTPDFVVVTVVAEDAPPIADCGSNVAGTVGERATLDGSASYDPEGATLDYDWSLSSVPACSDVEDGDVYNGSTATPSLIPDCDGIYVLSLVVSDGHQWSEPDLCYVDVASDNRLPVADAGDSEDLTPCNGSALTLDGYGSYDLDADTLTYQWTVVSVPAGSSASDADFSDASVASPTFNLPDDPIVAGEYTFQLQVYDGTVWSVPDIVTYNVLGESANNAPIANAGVDVTVEKEADCTIGTSYSSTCDNCEGEDVDLDGSASYDPDGDDVSFYWAEASGVVSFSSVTSPLTVATLPEVAAEYRVDTTVVYDISLSVSDGCGATGTDMMQITYVCTGVKGSTSF